MSVQAMAWVLEQVPPGAVTPIQRLVLLSIANHANAQGQNSWPGHDTIAREAGTDRVETVKDALRKLRADGWVTIVVNDGGDRHTREDRRPNRYGLPRMLDGGTQNVSPSSGTGGRISRERGDVSRVDGGTQTAPRTVREPSMNRAADARVLEGTREAAARRAEDHHRKMVETDAEPPSPRTLDHIAEARARLGGGKPTVDVPETDVS